ncbi:hypothetical protein CEB3_c17960 [Peptococcaceae bacterium CEB3]|nr:hypothetical protein CEB3_c17960 [Peptococcaceae bacterium CEB3]
MNQAIGRNQLTSVLGGWVASLFPRLFRRRAGWVRGSSCGYEYCCKVYDKPSKVGIDGGRISKLEIKKDGLWYARYDRGWDIKPRSLDAQDIVTTLLFVYGSWASE